MSAIVALHLCLVGRERERKVGESERESVHMLWLGKENSYRRIAA